MRLSKASYKSCYETHLTFLVYIAGAKVYIACRNSALGKTAQEDLRKLAGSSQVHYIPLKMGSLRDVRRFCTDFIKSKFLVYKYSRIYFMCILI